MSEYFVNMLPEDERSFFEYIPTVSRLLDFAVKNFADKQAVVGKSGTLTYRDLDRRVGELRAYIAGLGLAPGAKIGLMMRNNEDYICLFFAVVTSGYVAVPFGLSTPRDEVGANIEKMQVSVMFTGPEFTKLASGLGANVIEAATIPTGGDSAGAKDVDPADPCAIFFTGGTTGKPKGALLSHRAVMRGAYNGIFAWGSAKDQRYYALLPFSHVFGLIRNLLTCVYTGSVIYTCEDMRNIFADLAVAQPTILVLVPGLANMLWGASTLKGVGIFGGRLKTIIAGGAPVPADLVRRYASIGVTVYPGYGLTETANLVSGNGDSDKLPESVGKAYSAQELKVVDGELWIRGENVMDRYYNDPEATAAAMTPDGYFKTGDLVRIDENGYIYITGRIKNLIILPNGENVSPEELEDKVGAASPLVGGCLAYESVNDAGQPCIAIEVLPNMKAFEKVGITDVEGTLRGIVAKVNAGLPSFKQMTKFVLREKEFPMTATMKIDRKAVIGK